MLHPDRPPLSSSRPATPVPLMARAWTAHVERVFGLVAGADADRIIAAIDTLWHEGQSRLGRPVSWCRLARRALAALDPGAEGPAPDLLRRMGRFAEGVAQNAARIHLSYHDRLRHAAGGYVPEFHARIEEEAVRRARLEDFRGDPTEVYHAAVVACLERSGHPCRLRRLKDEDDIAHLSDAVLNGILSITPAGRWQRSLPRRV